jgi:ABC-type amino acid transport substrate-binding protein
MSVDFWQIMAYRLGVEVKFTPQLFADQLQSLRDGTCDALAGVFPLPERKKWFAFTRPYYMIDTYIYTDPGNTAHKTLKSLKGLKVAVVDGDSGQALADGAGLDTLVVAGYPQAVEAVAEGQAQATILDELVGDYFIKQSGVKGRVKRVGDPVDSNPMTIPVRKDDAMLLDILDKGTYMVSDSEFEGIYEKYLGAGAQ